MTDKTDSTAAPVAVSADAQINRAAIADPNRTPVSFSTGFIRGAETIADIVLRKPIAHVLRGLSLSDLCTGDVSSIIKLATRISEPAMTEPEVASLEAQDILQLSTAIMGFFNDTGKKSQNASTTS